MQTHKKRKRKIIWIALFLVLALIVAYGIFLRPRKPKYDTETAKTQDIVTYFSFSGNVEPGDEKVVTSTSPVRVKSLPIEEGATVKEDDDIIIPKNGSHVEAGMAGVLAEIYVDVDDTVPSGRDLFRIADYDHPVVAFRVDEYVVGALSTGMEVSVYVNALDKTLTGTITEIGREANVTGNIAYYDAKVSVPQDGTLRMGMSAEVTALKDKAEMATTISLKAVQFDEGSEPYVYCYSRGEEIVRQPVLLGINNGSIVQVLDGVKSGETVLLPKDETMAVMPFRSLRNQ
jgi:multidrug efflux pump subunit AcrA (membrane-fusion protein)